MIVLAREVFVCKCSTDVRADDPDASEEVRRVRWVDGKEEHFSLLDPAHHGEDHFTDFRGRLARGERWLLGLVGERVVSYTWLHTRSVIDYPYLPGCTFNVRPDVGYGYDAWTPPELRGGGLRRSGFLRELRILREMGSAWETSFFVKHQIEGATRSLGKVGIAIVPIWRVHLVKREEVAFELLVPGDTTASPLVKPPAQ